MVLRGWLCAVALCARSERAPPAIPLDTPHTQKQKRPTNNQDELYLQQSILDAHDAVRRLFGQVPALQRSRETKLLATLLY